MSKFKELNRKLIMIEFNADAVSFGQSAICPMCASDKYAQGNCSNCSFNADIVFKCPLKENNQCNVSKLKCDLKQLEYETCETYHKYGD